MQNRKRKKEGDSDGVMDKRKQISVYREVNV